MSSKSKNLLNFVQVGTLVALTATLVVAIYQDIILAETLRATEEQVSMMRSQLEDMRRETVLKLRPWIGRSDLVREGVNTTSGTFISEGDFLKQFGTIDAYEKTGAPFGAIIQFEFAFFIKNYGETPAIDVGFSVNSKGQPFTSKEVETIKPQKIGVVMPTESVPL